MVLEIFSGSEESGPVNGAMFAYFSFSFLLHKEPLHVQQNGHIIKTALNHRLIFLPCSVRA
jgi:hypothetical protein